MGQPLVFRSILLAAAFLTVLAVWLLWPAPAPAAKLCPPIHEDAGKFRVAQVGVGCERAREVISRFGRAWDNLGGGSNLSILGLRCNAATGGTYRVCARGQSGVVATSDPTAPIRQWHPPRPRLGAIRAARAMRTVLSWRPRTGWEAGYDRRVTCRKRSGRLKLRCSLSWIMGDIYVTGHGKVRWFPSRRKASISATLTYRNAYCQSTGGSNCLSQTKVGPVTRRVR